MKRIIHEAHRRSLWQVLGIYLMGSWMVLQVIDQLHETAGLPDWVPSLALVLLLIGLPMVLATAFVQDRRGCRVMRMLPSRHPKSTHRPLLMLNPPRPPGAEEACLPGAMRWLAELQPSPCLVPPPLPGWSCEAPVSGQPARWWLGA